MGSRSENIENRLIELAVQACGVAVSLPRTRLARHIGGQLERCSTASAANYAEARSAESKRDFIHKMKICLKELRETSVWLKLGQKTSHCKATLAQSAIRECDELIAIFVASVQTASTPSREELPKIVNRRSSSRLIE